MLMVVKEPNTLARSFDGEDSRSRVAVSDRRSDSGQAQVNMILLRFLHHQISRQLYRTMGIFDERKIFRNFPALTD